MTVRVVASLSALIALAGLCSPALAEEGDVVAAGRAEYQIACETCHGQGAKGDGPLAQYLTIKPSDLTQLAKNNHGEYPFLKVFQTIDGRAVVKAHGDGPMPIWGNRYKAEAMKDEIEPYRSYGAEAVIRARVLELTYYIQTLQE